MRRGRRSLSGSTRPKSLPGMPAGAAEPAPAHDAGDRPLHLCDLPPACGDVLPHHRGDGRQHSCRCFRNDLPSGVAGGTDLQRFDIHHRRPIGEGYDVLGQQGRTGHTISTALLFFRPTNLDFSKQVIIALCLSPADRSRSASRLPQSRPLNRLKPVETETKP